MSTPVLLTAMMTMTIVAMKSEAEVVEVRASEGESVLLNSSLQPEHHYDIRWTHDNLLVSSVPTAKCDGERCELLGDGSLRLHHVSRHYAGNYKLEVFNSSGKMMDKKEFLLRVDDSSRSTAGRSAAAYSAAASSCSLLLLLLLLFITLFILRRRRRMMKKKHYPISDQMESVYVEMHRSKISQEDGHGVSCQPDDSTETDIYM